MTTAKRDEDLIQQAQTWRERATAVLAASDLLKILDEVGEVRFSGSYAYGLMMTPDIDIHLLPAVWSRDTAVSLVHRLLLQDCWNARRQRPGAAALADVVRRCWRPASRPGQPRRRDEPVAPRRRRRRPQPGYSWADIARLIGVQPATARRQFEDHVHTWRPMTDTD